MIFRSFAGIMSPPAAPSFAYAVVTSFAGERLGRRRTYDFVSRSTPSIEHGDIVRIVGARIGGRVHVLVLKSPGGTMIRRGLLVRVVAMGLMTYIAIRVLA